MYTCVNRIDKFCLNDIMKKYKSKTMIGNSSLQADFQRAVGWCETVIGAGELALEL